MTALLGVICVIFALVTEFALRDFLIKQLDQRVSGAADRRPNGPPLGPFPPIGERPGPRDQIVLHAQVVDGKVYNPWLDNYGTHLEVPSAVYPTLVSASTSSGPATWKLGDLGNYRLVSRHTVLGLSTGGSTTLSDAIDVTGMPLTEVEETLTRLGWILAAVAVGGLLLVGMAGAWIIRGTLRPLQRVADTAARVTEIPLHEGEVALSERLSDKDTNPNTEVGKVGNALNQLLGHVGNALTARHASEMRVRQFVADASHELRTPLAAIRGYAELTRRAKDQAPPDIAHAMRRVESETERMTGLVEDLLLLAQIDAGRPLASESVDLSHLTVDAVSDAHVAGPEHRWVLDLPEEEIIVPGDQRRLHQVLANLLANARTHTPAGTTVRIGLSTQDGQVLWRVADNGPGIPESVRGEVFERFARGDTSRSRAAGSTGLGLAIVAAVVEAHHGSVQATSSPAGATFTVRLPLSTVDTNGHGNGHTANS